MPKPIRYQVVYVGGGLDEQFTNLQKAIKAGKKLLDKHMWFVWDSWNKCTAYNSWTGREEPHVAWQQAIGDTEEE